MKSHTFERKSIFLATSALLLLPHCPISWACAVCFGNPDSLQSKGVVAGVLLLLGVTVFVLGGVGFTFLGWARRAKILDQEKSSVS